MDEKSVEVSVTLTDKQACEFAQFLKRVDFDTYLRHAEAGGTKDERREVAYEMLDAGEKIRKALAEAGYAPR